MSVYCKRTSFSHNLLPNTSKNHYLPALEIEPPEDLTLGFGENKSTIKPQQEPPSCLSPNPYTGKAKCFYSRINIPG